GKREGKLLEDLQYKFKHMGPATARVFLWSVGYPLTPNEEEKRWMKGHPDHDKRQTQGAMASFSRTRALVAQLNVAHGLSTNAPPSSLIRSASGKPPPRMLL